MIPSVDNTGAEGQKKGDKERTIMISCRLFSDFVPLHVCALRKRELNPFGWNSCNGCVIGLLQNWIGPASKDQDQQVL